jgi:hypothetical protein
MKPKEKKVAPAPKYHANSAPTSHQQSPAAKIYSTINRSNRKTKYIHSHAAIAIPAPMPRRKTN